MFFHYKMRYWVVSKKKNPLFVWGWDRKFHSSQYPIVITRQALWCQSVILATDFSIPLSHSWWILIFSLYCWFNLSEPLKRLLPYCDIYQNLVLADMLWLLIRKIWWFYMNYLPGDFLPFSRGGISAPFPIKNSHLLSEFFFFIFFLENTTTYEK